LLNRVVKRIFYAQSFHNQIKLGIFNNEPYGIAYFTTFIHKNNMIPYIYI